MRGSQTLGATGLAIPRVRAPQQQRQAPPLETEQAEAATEAAAGAETP